MPFFNSGKIYSENLLSRHLGPSKPQLHVLLAIVLHFDTGPCPLLGGIFPMWGDFFTNTQFWKNCKYGEKSLYTSSVNPGLIWVHNRVTKTFENEQDHRSYRTCPWIKLIYLNNRYLTLVFYNSFKDNSGIEFRERVNMNVKPIKWYLV
jgi:hypothetical protein